MIVNSSYLIKEWIKNLFPIASVHSVCVYSYHNKIEDNPKLTQKPILPSINYFFYKYITIERCFNIACNSNGTELINILLHPTN